MTRNPTHYVQTWIEYDVDEEGRWTACSFYVLGQRTVFSHCTSGHVTEAEAMAALNAAEVDEEAL